MPPLVLASGSPRRVALLRLLAADFIATPSPVEETGSERLPPQPLSPIGLPAPFSVPPAFDPRLWAWRKAEDIADGKRQAAILQGPLVLGADTVVVGGDELYGKPVDKADAVRMLRSLKARQHYVITGFALLRNNRAGLKTLSIGATISRVTMRAFSQAELEGYVATGEPFDKAGAYALQGLGGRLVEQVEGCRTNVVGLPLCAVRRMLIEAGAALLPYPQGGYCEYCPLMQVK